MSGDEDVAGSESRRNAVAECRIREAEGRLGDVFHDRGAGRPGETAVV